MLKLKAKQASGRIAVWSQESQPKQKSLYLWTKKQDVLFLKRNLNLTQQLYNSNSDQLRNELHLLLIVCVLAGSSPIAVFPRFACKLYDALQHCWLVALYSWLCGAAYWELVHSSLKVNDLEHKFYILESITYIIHIPCIMILSVSWKHKIAAVFDRIAQFDLTSGYVVEGRVIRRFVGYQLLLILVYSMCCTFIVFSYCNFEIWKSLFNMSTYALPNIISVISFVPYLTLLQGIVQRLRSLTESLQKEFNRGNLVRRATLQQFRMQHTNLVQFTKTVNQTFGVSVLLLYISSIINFNSNLFLAYKSITNPNLADWPWWAYVILWIIMHLCKMLIILYFNHCVQKEQTNCLTLLSRVRIESEELIETINHFVLQLKANVRAHVACGLIVLDYKLITALMMATANVFIFLLQYDITYQALSRSVNETRI